MRLVDLGFFQQHEYADSLQCNTPLLSAEKKVTYTCLHMHIFVQLLENPTKTSLSFYQLFQAEDQLANWQKKITELHERHPWLLFFSIPKLLYLHSLLEMQPHSNICIAKEISFLFQNSLPVRNILDTKAVQVHAQYLGPSHEQVSMFVRFQNQHYYLKCPYRKS